MKDLFDIIIIGGGPGGYVSAIRAAQLGMKVACIDKEKFFGGTCLREGCIPSKALLNSSYKYWEANHKFKDHGINISDINIDFSKLMDRKNRVISNLASGIKFLLNKNKVTTFIGNASLRDKNTVSIDNVDVIKGKNIVIATGSKVSTMSNVTVDENNILSSRGILNIKNIPNRLCIVGGGYIGLEMASIWSRLGSDVTVIEFANSIIPQMDSEISNSFLSVLKNQGIKFKLSTKLTNVSISDVGEIKLDTSSKLKGIDNIVCDKLLVSIGRSPNTEGLNLSDIGVDCNDRGFIKVDEDYNTSVPGIYAIGDVIGGSMLAHKAEDEGIVLMEKIAGQKSEINYNLIPAIIYTHPEVASVGKTEEELKNSNIRYNVGKFPFKANSRSRVNDDTEGFVKLLSDKVTDEVLGAHIIGSNAGSIISEVVMAMEFRASSEDISRVCHAHPTETEAIKEAALSISNNTIHI